MFLSLYLTQLDALELLIAYGADLNITTPTGQDVFGKLKAIGYRFLHYTVHGMLLKWLVDSPGSTISH